ncbi:MAG: ADP-ribosylglycohydrolase family protein [Planctomycetaceae bacterium]|nr:ADP-ribosylglycohydrolase family protein [Planctomycetaceae bacterium]
MPRPQHDRLHDSLRGLSIGDAFGQQFFACPENTLLRKTAVIPWRWTDDTEMACSIVRILHTHGEIEQDALATSFATRFDRGRGYGPAMVFGLLPEVRDGRPWREAAGSLFDGSGSFGNGAAMRVAPLGAFFADDLEMTAEQARLSAEVTHAHPEGIAGGIAVAVATAVAVQSADTNDVTGPRTFLEAVIPHVPQSIVRERLEYAIESLGPRSSTDRASDLLGNGGNISAMDTVPFCLWTAGRFPDDYTEALWQTVSALGDMDTNCAIVGGILAARLGTNVIPDEWHDQCESLPEWVTTPS